MSAFARLRGAWKLVLVGFALRVVLGLTVGLVPAAWASQATRSFPRGELALADNGGLLLFDVLAHGAVPHGAGNLALALGVAAVTVGLLPFGALVFALREPGAVMPLLARSLTRMGTSLLLTGVALLALTLVVVIEGMAFGPIAASLSRKSIVTPLLLLVLALPAPALFGLFGDALRVRGLLADDAFIARFEVTWRLLRGRLAASSARYMLAAALEVVAISAAVTLLFAVIARSTAVFTLGLAGAACLLLFAAFTRAWLLGWLVPVVSASGEPAATDLEALHGSADVGYEAASTREPR